VVQTSNKSWWLLTLSGVLYATLSILIFLVKDADGSSVLRRYVHARNAVTEMSMLVLAAGACTVVAGLWNLRKGNSWLLVLNGISCSALGLLLSFGASRPVAFRTVAFWIVAMAVSIGMYELTTAQALRWHLADAWFLGAAGVLAACFALAFLAFLFRWMKLDPSPSPQTFYWLSSYFAFSALCMLNLALRHLRPQATNHAMGSRVLPTA